MKQAGDEGGEFYEEVVFQKGVQRRHLNEKSIARLAAPFCRAGKLLRSQTERKEDLTA